MICACVRWGMGMTRRSSLDGGNGTRGTGRGGSAVLASCVPPLPLTLDEEAADQPQRGFVRALHDRSRAVTSSGATTQRLEQHLMAHREVSSPAEEHYE